MAQPFNADIHCTPEIQEAVGLRKATCEVPRVGEKTRPGEQNYNQNSSHCVSETFTTAGARTIWNLIPAAAKNNPHDANVARHLALLANNANVEPTPGIIALVPRAADKSFGTKFYIAPGSGLFEGMRASHRFIAFVYVNMDDNVREKWYNLTGREQFEWYRAWERANRTHLRNAAATKGLRGTDLRRITTTAELGAVLTRSPSLGRRERPTGHPINQNDWNGVVRRLFGP